MDVLRGELAKAALEGVASKLLCEAATQVGAADASAARERFAQAAEQLLNVEGLLERLPAPEAAECDKLEDYLRCTLISRTLALLD